MSFPRYPEYKDSGVAWLGEVPGHWRFSKIKWLYRFVKRQDNADAPVLSVYRDYGVIEKSSRDDNINKTPEDLSLYQTVKIGDLAINKMKAWQGSLGVSPLFGITSPDYAIFEKWHEEHDKFLHYLLRSETMPSVYQTISNGIRPDQWRLEPDKFGHLLIPLPPLQEQSAIVAFLDGETAKIDALVVEQERLIELLKEKRQAAVSYALTKGLNSDASMKDSGIAWLGAVPKHWKVVRLGMISELIQTGPFGSQLHADDYVEDNIPVVNPSNISDGKIVPNWLNTVLPETSERLGIHRLTAGDIVFGRRGEMGRCALVTENESNWLCGTGCLKIKLLSGYNADYIARFLQSAFVREWLSLESVGSTMDNLNSSILSRAPIIAPPFAEQFAITSHLNHEAAKLDALVAEAQRAIDLLKERRAALISAAVTGQIDVRGLVASNHTPAERAPA